MLADGVADAAIDLTPAPRHGPINQAILDAGLHLYAEKPLAGTVADADRLIATAAERGVLFLCAPGVAVTTRVRWLADLIDSGQYGRPTLAVTHHADPGPAAWREYTGDPSPFYREGVGPVFDHGVYRLHTLTFLMGPVARVQAMGTIATPTRVVRGGPLTGQTIEVTTPDHVLINLQFASGALGQLLASFGTPATMAPWLELHFPMATMSFAGPGYGLDDPVSLYVDDDGPEAREDWQHGIAIPADEVSVGRGRGAPLHRLPPRRREAGPDRRARPPRPRRHARCVRVDRRRPVARDRHELLDPHRHELLARGATRACRPCDAGCPRAPFASRPRPPRRAQPRGSPPRTGRRPLPSSTS